MKLEKFSENLKDLMEENDNISQAELARRIHVAQSAISAWVCGTKEPSIESLWILADYFNCTIDQLVGREKLY